MNIFRLSALLIFLAVIATGTGCNTTDTGISKPIPDCFDGIQNQGEAGVDCGGPCENPCPSKMTAKIDGTSWESAGSIVTNANGSALLISGGNGTSSISLIHQGAFETGTYSLHQANYTNLGVTYFSDQGTITFTSWDASEHLISGTFSFSAWQNTGVGDTVLVTQGTFDFVTY